jgi:hypothetical protein
LRIFALIMVVGGLATSGGFVAYAFIQAIGVGGSAFDHLDAGQVFYPLTVVLLGRTFLGEAQRARERTERRSRFLAGDTAAIPLAQELLTSNGAGAIPTPPFELAGRGVTGSMSSLASPQGCAFASLLLIVPGLLILVGIVVSRPINHLISGGGEATIYATISATVIAEVLLFRRVLRLGKEPRGGRVIATEEGLVRPRGRRVPILIRWQDAQLLEIIAPSRTQGFKRAFALANATAAITWYEWSNSDAVQQHVFLALVAAQTGLSLRTLSPALEVPKEVVAGSLLPRPTLRFVYVALIILALAMLGIATAVLAVPLTGSLPVDAAIAFSFAAPALLLAVLSVRDMRAQPWDATRPPFALPPAPALASRVAVFVNWVNPFRRLLNGSMAVLFALDLVAAGASSVGIYVPWPGISRHHAPVPKPLLFVVAFTALFGFGVALAAVLSRANRISADESELVAHEGAKETRIAWAEISRIDINFNTDGGPSFAAASAEGATISWHTSHARRFEPPPGAFRVSAEELAAIVCQHSGKPLTHASAG